MAQEMAKWNSSHVKENIIFSLKDYVGTHWPSPDWNDVRIANAQMLIVACGKLQARMEADGIHFPLNPKTGTTISGEIYGGFRPQDCPIGAPHSAHKEGQAVDRYDPDNLIDAWLMAHQDALETCGIYIEHPDSTPTWSHWSTRIPSSGHHVFYP